MRREDRILDDVCNNLIPVIRRINALNFPVSSTASVYSTYSSLTMQIFSSTAFQQIVICLTFSLLQELISLLLANQFLLRSAKRFRTIQFELKLKLKKHEILSFELFLPVYNL